MIPTSSTLTAGGIAAASILPAGPNGTTTPNGAGDAHASPQSSRSASDRPVTIANLEALDTPRSAAHASAPAGTDPDLWRALSPDERSFFARTPRSDAPVYNRLSAIRGDSAPMRRGLHLDLRG